MRVALVLPSRSDPAHRRVASELGQALAQRGHRVFLFPETDGLRPAQARARLERLLRERGAEVCHVQFFSRGLGYLARTRWPPRTRLVLTHQGASVDLLENPESFARLARQAHRVTAVSSQGLAEISARFPEIRSKSSVVPNGVDLKRGAPAPARTGRRPYILCVGRLAAYKGIDILGLAFAGLSPGPDLVICGPDQTQGRLPRFLARLGLGRRLKLPGEVDPSRVRRLLSDCLFFVLPSRRENLPMALLEAMAAGKAVVATRVGGVPSLVSHEISGLLVEPRDAAGLGRAMQALVRDPRLRERLGRAARARARDFGWPAVASQYEKLYKK